MKLTMASTLTKTDARRALCGLCVCVSFVSAVGFVTGCAAVQAKPKSSDAPPLNVPAPPPHVIEPAPEPEPEPVNELPPAPTPPSGATRSPRREAPKPQASESKQPESKTEPPVEPAPAPPPAKPEPSVQLRTPATADTSTVAKTVRATIDRAKSTLSSVNYGPLNNERKKAYNDVKLFIEQAEDALKQGNLVFAQSIANKAETLAKELGGR